MNICTHICKYSCLFMFTLNYYHFKFTVLLPMFSHNDRATNTPHSPMDCQLNMSIKRMLLLKNMYTYTSSSSFYVAVHLCQVHGHFTYVFTQRKGYKHTTALPDFHSPRGSCCKGVEGRVAQLCKKNCTEIQRVAKKKKKTISYQTVI